MAISTCFGNKILHVYIVFLKVIHISLYFLKVTKAMFTLLHIRFYPFSFRSVLPVHIARVHLNML